LVTPGISRKQVLDWLGDVADPEIPVLSIADLGIIRGVSINDEVTVELTPTYSGCPATEVIEQSVIDELHKHGIEGVSIKRVLSPPWTTDWISSEGREKLKEYGIAPPEQGASKRELLHGGRRIACPRCESVNTKVVSEFGSTSAAIASSLLNILSAFSWSAS